MDNQSTYVTIRCYGNMYKVSKAPYESDERAYDRAWYIAKQLRSHTGTCEEHESLSHAWANAKYFDMKYVQ